MAMIFIVNLPSSENRREKIKEQLDKFALNYSFFEATDGYKIKITDLATGDSFTGLDIKNNKNKFGYQSTYKITCDPSDVNPFEFKYSEILKDWNDPITAGELGIWCSYLRLYKKINDEKIEDAIIFEDDIIIKSENFDKELSNFIKHVPKDYDMAFLDLNLHKGQQFQLADNPYINKFSQDAKAWGNYAILYSKKIIEKLLSIDTYSQRIDNYIWDLANQQDNENFYVSAVDFIGVVIEGSIICEMGRYYSGSCS